MIAVLLRLDLAGDAGAGGSAVTEPLSLVVAEGVSATPSAVARSDEKRATG